MNVAALLERAVTLDPKRDAWRDADASATYPELFDRVRGWASGLRGAGLLPGDRVLLRLPNGPAMLELLWAVIWAGLVVVPVNQHLHPREVAYIARHSGARLIVGAGPAPAELQACAQYLDVRSTTAAEWAGQLPLEMADVPGDSPAWIFYTSGTTGAPKGATLTHRNLLTMTLSYYVDVDPSVGPLVHLHAAPLSHGSGLYLLPAVGRAAVNVLCPPGSFDPDTFLALAGEHKATHATFLAPTMLRRLVDAVEAGPRPDLSSLRSIVVGGAALLPSDLERAIAAFGPIITTMYGQGESPMTIAAMPPSLIPNSPADSRRASCGRPFTSVQVRIAGPDGRTLPHGRTGEIWVRGDTIMRGYWEDEEATSRAIVGGWLRTGDIGRFDDGGYLYLTDRSKDLIISGGSNIYPREVEEILASHPGIAEVAVVGAPDPEWGERVVAFVVRRPTVVVTEAALIELCRQHLASYKKPSAVVFVEDLPKNPNGKVLKRELRERLATMPEPSPPGGGANPADDDVRHEHGGDQ